NRCRDNRAGTRPAPSLHLAYETDYGQRSRDPRPERRDDPGHWGGKNGRSRLEGAESLSVAEIREREDAEGPHGGGPPATETRTDVPGVPDVYVVEPLLPQRLRRPSDLLRLLATLAALAAVILLALVAKQTLNGLERDVTEGTTLVPLLSRVATFIGGAAVLIVPVAFAVERVFHRDGLRVAEGLIAAIVGMVGAFLIGQWLVAGHADDLSQLLTGGRDIEPLNTLLTSVLA